ncbi:CUE domain-containing protein [Fagus crenata]
MSAGVCGKRVGFEEIFGPSSPTSCSSAKRPRSSSFGSGSDDSVLVLLQMFPDLDPKLVETVCRNHNNKIEDAIVSLREHSFTDVNARNRSQSSDSANIVNCADVPGQSTATCSQMPEQRVEDVKDMRATVDYGNSMDGSKWVDLFVHEMMNATDIDDARGRAARILEAFEHSITAPSRASEELEHASLKEHLQSLLNDNQILKRAVSIQHERNLEHEDRIKGVEQLKHVLSQYQEQVRSLELTNYSLKLHLQRAQESSSIPGQFHPDIY